MSLPRTQNHTKTQETWSCLCIHHVSPELLSAVNQSIFFSYKINEWNIQWTWLFKGFFSMSRSVKHCLKLIGIKKHEQVSPWGAEGNRGETSRWGKLKHIKLCACKHVCISQEIWVSDCQSTVLNNYYHSLKERDRKRETTRGWGVEGDGVPQADLWICFKEEKRWRKSCDVCVQYSSS